MTVRGRNSRRTISDYPTGGVKPVADVYGDDRAVPYSGDADKDLEIIRYFRTWSGHR